MRASTDLGQPSRSLNRYERLKSLCTLAAEIAKVRSERDTLRKIVSAPVEFLGAESAHLALVDKFDKEIHVVASSKPVPARARGRTPRLEETDEAREALGRGTTVLLRPRAAATSSRSRNRRSAPTREIAYLPLVSAGQSFGLLILRTRPRRSWTREELELAEHFAAFATVAIENSRLLSQLSATDVRLRSLIEHIPAIIYTAEVDPPYRTLYISPQTESILGYSPREWTDHPGFFMTIVHPADAQSVIDLSAEAVRKRGFSSGEYRVIDRRGEVRWVRDEGVLVNDPSGRPIAWHGIVVDITGMKRLQDPRTVAPPVSVERTSPTSPKL